MQQYPVGGPRQPVYDLMRSLGFSESNWSDKFWRAPDGIEVRVFGAGSCANVSKHGKEVAECQLDQLPGVIASLR